MRWGKLCERDENTIMRGELTKWFSLNNLKAIKNRFHNKC
jgi:hypothetical protein